MSPPPSGPPLKPFLSQLFATPLVLRALFLPDPLPSNLPLVGKPADPINGVGAGRSARCQDGSVPGLRTDRA